MKENFIVGIDIGTKKICSIIGQVKSYEEEENLEIIGYGVAEARRLKKGLITDIHTTVEDIRKSVKEAELTAGVEIESAYVNISGKEIESLNAKGSINITGKNREITDEDIERVITHGSSVVLPPDKTKLHILPQEYVVDSQEGIINPVGMIGSALDVYINIIRVSKTATRNLLNCLKKAKINVDKIVLSHIASAEAVLHPDEKELGVALLDIGEGITDISVFEKGALSYCSTDTIGGYNFTHDLAIGIRTPPEKAENIKRKYGLGLNPEWKNENIEVPSVGSGKDRLISISLLEEILRPRAEELFLRIKRKIDDAGYGDAINAGIVITGGTALLKGLPEVADEIFSTPVRIGTPHAVGGLITKVSTPDFSTSVGLLKYGYLDIKSRGDIPLKQGNIIQKVKNWFFYN